MRARDEVVVMDHQVAHGARRHVEAERLPMLAVIERDIDLRLASGEEESFPLRILAHDVDGPAVRDAVRDVRPRLPAVFGPVDVRPEVVEPQRVDRRIRLGGVEVRRLEDRHFRERHQLLRRDVLPVLPGVCGDVNETIVGARPDAVAVERRRCERIDDAALRRLCRRAVGVDADVRRNAPRRPRQVGTDLRPRLSAVQRLPDGVRREVEEMRVGGGEDDRHRAQRPVALAAQRHRADLVHLVGAAVVP